MILTSAKPEVTQLLLAWSNGDEGALAALAPLVQRELHTLARRYLSHERPGHTLQPSDLVHEAYLRLIDCQTVQWQNRAHFFGIAAQVMRRILVDYARRRNELKHGGGAVQISLTAAEQIATERGTDVLGLDEALRCLATFDPRKSQIVELRFFGGLSESETAEVLKVSLRTIQREWNLARAWLYQQLRLEGM
jgi:RNA polymerase sigma factor (TIGR02999 family)